MATAKTDKPKTTAKKPSAPAAAGGSPSPTAPDAVNQNAKLGGQTVAELSSPAPELTPAQNELHRKGGADGGMVIDPAADKLLVGNHYTARVALDFDPGPGDSIMFIHPAGWDVKAAVHGRTAAGSFLVERPREMTFGFRVNGKKIASTSYEVHTGGR